MTEQNLHITVEELAEYLSLKTLLPKPVHGETWAHRLELIAIRDKDSRAIARRMLAALESDGLTPRQRAADALYEAAEYTCRQFDQLLRTPSAFRTIADADMGITSRRLLRAALARADGKE